jgi:hypothetical protein
VLRLILKLSTSWPQSPSETWWKGELTRYSNEGYQKLVNGIGNLTLTSYDPGNNKNTNIGLNKYFIQCNECGPIEIGNRAEVLATAALQLWPDLVQRDDIR